MYLLKRLKEPSTWASLSAASAALASVPAFSAHALTASAVVNHIKLMLIGLCILVLIALLSGCASAPICPEVKVTFCPVK